LQSIEGEGGPGGRNVLLMTAPDRPAAQSATFRAQMAARGIGVQMPASFPDALATTITESPDIIVMDAEMGGNPSPAALPSREGVTDPVSELISALKVEEEAARIPIVLLSETISDAHVLRHAGGASSEGAGALEYLYDQLIRVTSTPGDAGK